MVTMEDLDAAVEQLKGSLIVHASSGTLFTIKEWHTFAEFCYLLKRLEVLSTAQAESFVNDFHIL